jgi:hypothetical protein
LEDGGVDGVLGHDELAPGGGEEGGHITKGTGSRAPALVSWRTALWHLTSAQH